MAWHGPCDVVCNKTPTSAVGDGPASSRIPALSLRKRTASSSVNLIAVYGGFWVWSDGHDRPPTFAADVHATEMVHAFLESRGFTAYHSL